MPLISVIIPVYKVEDYIEECMLSVSAQTFRDFELIIIDDCSPDRSMEIARRVCMENCADIPVKYLRTPVNSGQSVARNMGIDAASGTYLYFIDSDDYVSADALELLTAVAQKYPQADIVYGAGKGIGLWKYVHTLDLKAYNLPECVSNASAARNLMLRYYYLPAYPWNRLFRREWLNRHNLRFKPGILAQDLHLNFYMAKHVGCIAFCTEPTYFYRMNEGSVSIRKNRWQYICIDWIICDWMRHLSLRSLPAQLLLILHCANCSYLYWRGPEAPLPPLWKRIPAAIVHLVRLMQHYGPQPPKEEQINNN